MRTKDEILKASGDESDGTLLLEVLCDLRTVLAMQVEQDTRKVYSGLIAEAEALGLDVKKIREEVADEVRMALKKTHYRAEMSGGIR